MEYGLVGASSVSSIAIETITVDPVIEHFSDGSTVTSYFLPSGEEVERVTTPPPGFNPLTASRADLLRFNFPPPPAEADALLEWTAAMADYRSNDPPSGTLDVVVNGDARYAYGTCPPYCNWGGYTAGTWGVENHRYVAVKGVIHVPDNTGTCDSTNHVGIWIGLGGTTGANDLDQQGISCGNPFLGETNRYKPFLEFCCPDVGGQPRYFCGYDEWTLNAGDKIYMNMSFQTSSNTAYFYLENQTSGVAHGCAKTPPSGWEYNGNTADWEAEAPTGTPVDFDHVRFTNARAQLYSNSNWVSLGSQAVTKTIAGLGIVGGHNYRCIVPGNIASGTEFTDEWYPGGCGW